MVCILGVGLKEINKKNGKVSFFMILGLEKLRFIRGVMVIEGKNFWVVFNMGLFVKFNISNLVFKVGICYGFFDIDFEYKSFEVFGEKVLVKGDKYSYLLDEEKLIESFNVNLIGEMFIIFSYV